LEVGVTGHGELAGKVAVVTGGTSGLALATARLFEAEGAHVYITGRDEQRLAEALATTGGNVTGVQADAGDMSAISTLIEQVARDKGTIDILFISANIPGLGSVETLTEAVFDEAFDTNVKGAFFLVQRALPYMPDGANIILVGTVATVRSSPGTSVYAASKIALRAFARCWVQDLRRRRIRVNVLSPGVIDTPRMADVPAEQMQKFIDATPAGRKGRPEDIARAALFLASDSASFITGIELFVDGGMAQV
jgi:NAD(P)-dependent dehydrogenase (short-subunit alcohol dehydrogenase family)